MLRLAPADQAAKRVVLGLAAHPDDLEIGCAGTILQLLGEDRGRQGEYEFHWAVLTGTDARLGEARAAAADLLGDSMSGPLRTIGFDDGFLPERWGDVKRELRAAVADVQPDLVLAPHRGDAHQDHRLLGELAWQLFRGSTIWEYEIPKWDGDLGQPNLFVPLSDDVMADKVALLRRNFASQRTKPWYDEEVFRGLCRLRGMECGARYAEAFHVHKVIVGHALGSPQSPWTGATP